MRNKSLISTIFFLFACIGRDACCLPTGIPRREFPDTVPSEMDVTDCRTGHKKRTDPEVK